MQNTFKISMLAILAGMLTTLPASALSLNLGGGGLVGSGSGSSAGSGGLLNVGGQGGALVNLGSGRNDGLVNIGGTDDGAVTVGKGGDLLNIGGDDGATVDVDLGTGSKGLLNLGGDDPVTANVNLGSKGETDANVLLDLFGSADDADGTTADVTVGTGTGGADVVADLFGNSGSGAGGGIVAQPPLIQVGPVVPIPGGIGSSGNGAAPGGNAGDVADAGPTGGGMIAAPGAVAPGAVVRRGAGCFTPTAAQADRLANRHAYGSATFASWADVTSLKVVDVNLCGGAGAAIGASANVDRLQSFVAGNAALKTGLGKTGRSPDEVIAVDKTGRTLTLYVM